METINLSTVKAPELAALWRDNPGLVVIDVRTAGEYESVHAEGAKSLPLQDLDPARFFASLGAADTPVYLLCKSGVRATQAAELLLQAGARHPVVVEGGTDAWAAAGLPIQRRGRKVLPLDRQMRTVAGTFILIGALLALTVNPSFVWIPLFMGCGLVFSGITGICPMLNALARMPWNRASCGCDSSG